MPQQPSALAVRAEQASAAAHAAAQENGSPPQKNNRSGSAPKEPRPDLLAGLEPQLDPGADDQQLLEQVLLWYQRCLVKHPAAERFLRERALVHPQLIDHFQLGMAERKLNTLLPPNQTPQGYRLRARLQQVGVFRRSGHGHFNGCLTIPLRTAEGRIAEIHGVRTARKRSPATAPFERLTAQHRPCGSSEGIFHREALAETETLLLSDGPLNALSLWCAGLEHVSYLLPDTDPQELLEALAPSGVRQVVLVPTNTQQGTVGAEALRVQLVRHGLAVNCAVLPAGADANQVLREQGGRRLAQLVQQAAAEGRAAVSVRRQPPPAVPDQACAVEATCPASQERSSAEDRASLPAVVDSPAELPVAENEKLFKGSTPPAAVPCSEPNNVSSGDIFISYDDRHYRVRGLGENGTLQRMKVQLKVARDGLSFVNHVDLYSATGRRQYVREASEELYTSDDLIKRDLGRLLGELEPRHEQLLAAAEAPREPAAVQLSEAERSEALELLRAADLLEQIGTAYEMCGLVGERENRLLCYLGCVSRLLPRPLSLLIQSSSAAGKTTLVDATLELMPAEQQVRYSALTGQSLYYLGTGRLRHKILSIAEEEGVAQASYALKLLQSDGRLTIATAGKDEGTGRQQTQEYTVEGPVMMLLTTTAERPDAELANRCLSLRVNESAGQTGAIQARQRQAYTLAGREQLAEAERLCRLHQNAQRLLEPLPVVLPWAERLGFRADQVGMRREHAKYLALIASLALLHQYQRRRWTHSAGQSCVVAAAADVAVANRLISVAVGQSLDALLPQTRQLLVLLDDYVGQRARAEGTSRRNVRLRQRELREAFGWSDFTLRRHLRRLVELEYLLVYRTGRGNERAYELLFDGQGRDGRPFVLGLTAAEELEGDE